MLFRSAKSAMKVEMDIQIDAANTGTIQIEVHEDWAPLGANRFRDLVTSGFYTNARWHRVIPDFIAQVGIAADPAIYAQWGNNRIKDDPVKTSNTRGTVSFATSGPDARSCQVFVNYGDNASLDSQGFSPIGKVTAGMDVIDRLQVMAKGPDQTQIKQNGNKYLDEAFGGKLSEILEARVI